VRGVVRAEGTEVEGERVLKLKGGIGVVVRRGEGWRDGEGVGDEKVKVMKWLKGVRMEWVKEKVVGGE
uniref:hypothetical protein n=1 Tax=Neisseria sicca TaxID=490 RepID=UPI001649F972